MFLKISPILSIYLIEIYLINLLIMSINKDFNNSLLFYLDEVKWKFENLGRQITTYHPPFLDRSYATVQKVNFFQRPKLLNFLNVTSKNVTTI